MVVVLVAEEGGGFGSGEAAGFMAEWRRLAEFFGSRS